jgi:hypothetical protein
MRRAKLLDRRAIPLTPGDVPVGTDVFIHNLDGFALETLRRAATQGLMPFDLDLVDDGIVILRLARPRF